MRKRTIISIALLMVIMMTLSGCGLIESTNIKPEEVNYDNVISHIDSLNISLNKVNPVKGNVPERTTGSDTVAPAIMYELPDIDSYDPIIVGKSNNDVEIFLPLEDNGSTIVTLVYEAAKKYNNEHTDSSVTIRTLESELANDFIKSGAYLPKGYIASNELYGFMLKESGIKVSKVTNKLVGNTIGIVLCKDAFKSIKLVEADNKVDVLFKAISDGKVKIGYPNPTNNPTGLNFVISMLFYFDSTNPFSMEATTDFGTFQSKVQVAYSTNQLKESLKRGTTDGFVMEYEAYKNDKTLADYEFIPFGERHDYPLYAVGTLTEAEMNVLTEFAKVFTDKEISDMATGAGFNQNSSYESKVNVGAYDGLIGEVLSYWKTEKKAGKKIAMYFVCDISGSMSGKKIEALKESALNAMQYIGEDNLVGLMSYNSNVYLNLSLNVFNEEQQSYFAGSISKLSSGGGTATNNALLQALKLLDTYYRQNPDTIPMIFLLSDGYTESGYSLKRVESLIAAFDIPIYTIGYEANLDELKNIAKINNGEFINASRDDVGYYLKSLFDAQI